MQQLPSTAQSNNSLATLQPIKLPPPVWASLATTPVGAGSRNVTNPQPTENGGNHLFIRIIFNFFTEHVKTMIILQSCPAK